ncbi:hypothetical protein CTA1_7865 [Colletotrichum tanaceti]|uniref:TTL domain-containing protein n=1 Tax=Colletotrichum tanaceti TaxID=1306861 RepID=A0A4U6XUH5_9PEZI|nr:hypothetical protein CTA1_7865 [Colletotrichum tanaceti]
MSDYLLPVNWKAHDFDQICSVSAELFRAAVYIMADKFTIVDKCFELFAADFFIDTDGIVWLLEVHKAPAFYDHVGKARLDDEHNVAARLISVLDEMEKLAKSNFIEISPESRSRWIENQDFEPREFEEM